MGGIPGTAGAGAAAAPPPPPPLGDLADPPPGGRGASPPAPATRLPPPVLEGGRATPPFPLVAGVTGRGPCGRAGAAVLAPPVPLTPAGGLGTADATGFAPPLATVDVLDASAIIRSFAPAPCYLFVLFLPHLRREAGAIGGGLGGLVRRRARLLRRGRRP